MTKAESARSRRYNRETWLAAAMDALVEDGPQALNTVRLAERLGVSRGSFYHHFESRDAFIEALLDRWVEITSGMIERLNAKKLPVMERLLFLMTQIHRNDTDRLDIPLRVWAAQDARVAEKLREVDGRRYEFVKGMFAELGFSGSELEERTRLFIISESRQKTVSFPKESRRKSDSLEMRLALYTSPIETAHPDKDVGRDVSDKTARE